MSLSLMGFSRQIVRIADRMLDEVQDGMTSDVADDVLGDVRTSVPVGRTGNLKRAWVKQKATSRKRGRYIVGARMARAGYANVIVGGRRRGKRGWMIGSKQTGRGHIVRKVQRRQRARLQRRADERMRRAFR